MLPQALGDLKRQSFEAQDGQGMGIATSSATASYAAADRQVKLTITDAGGLGGLAALGAGANMTSDRESDSEVERVYKQGNRSVREQARKDGSHAEVTVITENGVIVEARGERVDLATLKGVVEVVNLGQLEAMKRVAKQ